MRNSQSSIQLPDSVECILTELSNKNNIAPAQDAAREKLAELGEQASLTLLRNISHSPIRNLTGLIIHKTKHEFKTPSSLFSRSPVQYSMAGFQPTMQGCNGGSPNSFSLSGGSAMGSAPCSSGVATEFERGTTVSLSNSKELLYGGCLGDGASDAGGTVVHSVSDPFLITGESMKTYMCDDWDYSMRTKDSITTKTFKQPVFTEHLKALGKLDFPKAFLVLSYVTPHALEDVLSVHHINGLKDLSMADVESNLMQALLAMNPDSDFYFERKSYDWKPDGVYKYHCYVDRKGNYKFRGPDLANTSTHLQRVLGDSILQVHFAEELPPEDVEKNGKNQNGHYKPTIEERKTYQRLAREGIFVGLRRYKFFVFKDGDKDKKDIKKPWSSSVKCYFVCTESFAEVDKGSSYILSHKSIHEARCLFMHIHTVASLKKYITRFTLVLSKTIPFGRDISNVMVSFIKDIPCSRRNKIEADVLNEERLIHTDGTGFISEDLASQCPEHVFEGKDSSNQSLEASPLLIQCRLFYNGYAIKGTLLVNRTLPCQSLYVRESMIKVERDKNYVGCQYKNSLEICRTSYKPNTASLSRHLIALLNYGGVPKDFFIERVKKALDKVHNDFKDETKAWKVIQHFKGLDEDHECVRMLSCGIPLHEPFLQHRLKIFMRTEIQKFKEGKVLLEDSYLLMGTADPTGKLEPDQVCIILDHGQVSGKVLVYRNPGLHFGDIHVFKATYVEEIEKTVGDSKFGIFFSTQGSRSAANEIGNGDFDGDLYWVCINAKVLKHFKPETPWMRTIQDKGIIQPKPTDFPSEKLEEELFEEFLNIRFAPSNAASVAFKSWMTFMDRLLTPGVKDTKEFEILKQKMQKLTNIYYQALDAPKTGEKVKVPKDLQPRKQPHFMSENHKDINRYKFYESTSVLGEIHDLTSSYDGVESDEIWTIPCFQDANVGEVRALWHQRYVQYKQEMTTALRLDRIDSSKSRAKRVNLKYKEFLYEAASLNESEKQRQQIYNEACAIYQVVYEDAKLNKNKKCYFAWRVAGEALCDIYIYNQQKQPIPISPSFWHGILS